MSIGVEMKINYSSSDPVENLILIEVEGIVQFPLFLIYESDYIFPCVIRFQTELSEVFSYEEIHALVRDLKPFAKSQNPIWKVKWRGIDVIVKGLFDEFVERVEISIHK